MSVRPWSGAIPVHAGTLPSGTLATGGGGTSTLRLGVALVLLCASAALVGPYLVPYAPDAYVGAPLEPPGPRHLLGTNDVGQDLLSALVHGARVSMTVALLAGAAGLALALLVGLPSGALRGRFDAVAMRCVDILMAIPHLPLMIVLAAFLGPGLGNVIIVIVVLAWVRPARVIRSQVLTLRSRGYVHSARLFGGSWVYVMWRHLLPALAPIAASVFVSLGSRAVIMEASLAFLGIGDPTVQSWGMMMRRALDYRGIYLTFAWTWWLLPPGICLSVLIAGLAMLGTAVESYSNTRLSRHEGG
jgi:peptide/nickel transport system permease protein